MEASGSRCEQGVQVMKEPLASATAADHSPFPTEQCWGHPMIRTNRGRGISLRDKALPSPAGSMCTQSFVPSSAYLLNSRYLHVLQILD